VPLAGAVKQLLSAASHLTANSVYFFLFMFALCWEKILGSWWIQEPLRVLSILPIGFPSASAGIIRPFCLEKIAWVKKGDAW